MATTKIASEIYKIDCPIKDVYDFLSDFNRIGKLIEMARQFGLGQSEQLDQISEKIEGARFTEDTCFIKLNDMGEMGVKILEKEDPKMIKLGGDETVPFDFNLWIQLLENGPYDTRMKLTFHGELNMMLKMVLKGKLEKGLNQLGEGLSKIPYMMLK